MKLDGSRISSAWLGTCLDADGIAIVISTIGNDDAHSLNTSSMNVRRTLPSIEHLHDFNGQHQDRREIEPVKEIPDILADKEHS
jgi:hypothetical protein